MPEPNYSDQNQQFCSILGGSLAFFSFGIDQYTKAIALANTDTLIDGIEVFPGFNLILVRNFGVSFGLLSNLPPWTLVATAIAISLWIITLLFRTERLSEAVAFGLILGGAAGNTIDRIRFDGVTDFLDFYIGQAHWPAFNFADVSIVCGVFVLVAWPVVAGRWQKNRED